MKIFIAAIGSGGDLNPLLAIGVEFARQGHEVVVLAGDWHAAAVKAAGLSFHPVLEAEVFSQVGAMARDLGSEGGAWVAFYRHAVMPAIESVYDYVAEAIEPGNTLLVGAIQAIGLRLVEERFGVPLVTVLVQPRAKEWEGGEIQANARFDAMFRPLLNRHRRRIGLPPLDRPFERWMIGATRLIGLFPPWFVSPDIDLPNQGTAVDFLLSDPGDSRGSTRALDAFLARHDAPWVFTYGTGNEQAAAFFRIALDASELAGVPVIFLSRFRESLPDQMPDTTLALDYVPLDMLLPHCSGIVHHGGIGTCAQSIHAGIPQIIVPMAFDQFSNAARITRLGLGVTLQGDSMTADALARNLVDLSGDSDMQTRCRRYARSNATQGVAARCCDEILRLAAEDYAHAGMGGKAVPVDIGS